LGSDCALLFWLSHFIEQQQQQQQQRNHVRLTKERQVVFTIPLTKMGILCLTSTPSASFTRAQILIPISTPSRRRSQQLQGQHGAFREPRASPVTDPFLPCSSFCKRWKISVYL
jgi:hypothetical protein